MAIFERYTIVKFGSSSGMLIMELSHWKHAEMVKYCFMVQFLLN